MSSAITHPNVVMTYDYLVKKMDKGGGSTRRILQETQLIMEYCDRGSLSDVIEKGVFHRASDGQARGFSDFVFKIEYSVYGVR